MEPAGADHYGPVGVAEDYTRSHVEKLIHKEKTALEHLLMYQHTAACLSADHQKNTDEIGRQTRPRSVGDCHRGAVDKILYLIDFFLVYTYVVALDIKAYAYTRESFREHPEIGHSHILKQKIRTRHSSHTDKAAHLDHVRQ